MKHLISLLKFNAMKSIFTILLAFLLISSQAQDVSDYKYISIPTNFSGFDAGQYQLNNYLRLLISQKNYEVLSDKKSYWPEEAKLNPCMVLNADVDKVNSTFNNKVILKFEDCNQTVLYKFEGESNIKEFEKGYKEALRLATAKVQHQNAKMPTYRQEETKDVTIITKTTTENPGTALFKKYSKQPSETKISINTNQITQEFTYEGNTYFKSDLENGEFILISPDKTKILAHYYPSTRNGIYHVYLSTDRGSGSFTLGYYDGQNLSYEYLSDVQIPILIKFTLKY